MKRLAFLLAPSLLLAGTYSGSVALLDGTPVVGAVVMVGTDSVLTTPSGFALSGSSSATARLPDPRRRSVRWTLEEGRLRASFSGRDLSGRFRTSEAALASNGSASPREVAGRAAAASDTLRVYWKGKRLVDLPVSGDTSVSLRIDTAWSDDAGIPWNPRIPYASLRDSRDGKTYRTVTIGTRTWMAENLNFADPTGRWFVGIDSSEPGPAGRFPYLDDSSTAGSKYGRYYPWTAAMSLHDSCDTLPCLAPARGICPSGWHVPSNEEWDALHPGGHKSATDSIFGTRLKAVRGWGYLRRWTDSLGMDSPNGQDAGGFRALNAGVARPQGGFNQKTGWGWWANFDLGSWNPRSAWYLGWNDPWRLETYEGSKRYLLPVRCIQD